MQTRKWLLFLLLAFGLGVSAHGRPEGTKNSYRQIGASNVFRLKSFPAKEVTPRVLPRLTLLGITTLPGYKLALLRMQMPAKPPELAWEKSVMLTPGQRDGELEILDIEEKAGAVKVRISGTEAVLTFEKDGLTSLPPPHQSASRP